MILGEVVQRAARERPGDLAIADGTALISNAQLATRTAACARALLGAGVAHGDRVAIWAPNSWRWIVAAAGAHAIGAVLVPINTRYKGDEAAQILARSEARVLVTSHDFLGTRYLDLLRKAGAKLPETIVTDDDDGWNTFHDGMSSRASDHDLVRARVRVGPDDAGDLMFTSGTTGAPKAILATHAQTLRAYRDWAQIVGLRRGDRYLVVAPFFHSFGYKAGWLAALASGATVHPHAVFDPDTVLARIATERISVLPGPPTLYVSLLAHPGRASADLRSLRLAVTGAAVVPVELVRRMREDLGFETVLTGYGLTESTGVATLCRPGDDAATIATTSGRAMPGVEIAIHAGEIVVRGYNVAAPTDADGWLHTGDAGSLDARGNLRITDRIKDMFIVGGFNAYPAEIEAAMRAHPQIAEVAVVGAPDERLGEVGVAFVVARAGDALDETALIAWCRERMANFKVPRRVIAVDTLPLNASGKVLKHVLRARL
jgi:acyl-CoA synthetase (AMP-forming)/AMP-acid ligase II